MRKMLEMFEASFAGLHQNSIGLLDRTGDAVLYKRPRELPQTFAMFTIGEYLLRSAAAVEQTFGGISTRLWDDPFEWTLPEKLNSVDLVRQYLDEADATRATGLRFLADDADLAKEIPAPSAMKPIGQVLLDTIARASHFQGRAYAVYQMLLDEGLPRI